MDTEPGLRLAEGQRLLDTSDPEGAQRLLMPLTGHPDPEIAGPAWLAVGTARYRLDDEPGALAAWRAAANSNAAIAWQGSRAAAEQHVRDGDLEAAIGAYREAEQRAPAGERGAIANRIAWLLKETGHDFAARRQFNRARGAYATYAAWVTWGVIAVNLAVYLLDLALVGSSGGSLVDRGLVYGPAVAAGEWWRLITSAFLHLSLLHIAFNMYALWLFGPIIEQMYGHVEYAVAYLLCAVGGSVLTILLEPQSAAAGASGAIFGLLGMAFVVSRRHHVVIGPQARAILSQAGVLLLINLVITFASPRISWTGHLGGLLVGLAIGWILAPTQVATLGGMFRGPDGASLATPMPVTVRAAAYLAVAAALVVGIGVAIARIG
ncbi:MAG: rhomboid family intramembrane serine protease [Chloroflexota bacterium]|nr:rhomboid family intramembrane serine protease [Chloroflexota bacterium]